MQRFQKDNLSTSKRKLGSIAMDQYRSQGMNGTDTCPLSFTTLSPAIDINMFQSQYESTNSIQHKDQIFTQTIQDNIHK